MKFCPKCEVKLRKAIDGLSCPKCGHLESSGGPAGSKSDDVIQQQKQQQQAEETSNNNGLNVFDESDDGTGAHPTIKIECEKCGNDEAVWWMLQTRSADEPTTQFYRCTKCRYTWRDYS